MPEITPEGNGGQGTEGKAPEEKTPETPKPITFKSQEELDAIIEARVARAKPKDYDELVALRDKVKAREDEEKTELTKAQERAAKAEAAATEAAQRANRTLIRAAIITEAASANAVDPDVVVQLLAGNESITVDEDQVKGAKQAVKKLLEDKPYLVKAEAGKPGASGGQFGGNDARTLDERIREAESKGNWAEARSLKAARMVAGA